jgi:hypothetical protein
MSRKYIIVSGMVALLLLLLQLVSGPMSKLEQGLLDVRFRVRGQVPADTNVVVLYFDNDDIASLGGGTLKRNYYALLIDVLTKNQVAAIGLEPFFGEQSLEYPEQDDVLASTAAASGRVVFSAYFRLVEPKGTAPASSASPEAPAYGKMKEPVAAPVANCLIAPVCSRCGSHEYHRGIALRVAVVDQYRKWYGSGFRARSSSLLFPSRPLGRSD